MCAKKTKITIIQQFFSFKSASSAVIESTTMHACEAADIEHACAAPCLRAEESMCMRPDTLINGGGQWLGGEEIVE